jgi:hypothetical protein
MMAGRRAVDIPEAFLEVDEWAATFTDEMRSTFGSYDEIARTDVELVSDDGYRSMWPNASGGVAIAFTGHVSSSYGSGWLPKRLEESVAQQSYEALKSFLMEHATLAEAVAELTDPQRRLALYEYAADKLGKTKDEVDHDVGEAVWNLRDELDDKEREELDEHQDQVLDGKYEYGIDIAYLDTNDTANPWREEPLVEITLTFREPDCRTADDLDRRYLTLDACREGANELLAHWAISTFQGQ